MRPRALPRASRTPQLPPNIIGLYWPAPTGHRAIIPKYNAQHSIWRDDQRRDSLCPLALQPAASVNRRVFGAIGRVRVKLRYRIGART